MKMVEISESWDAKLGIRMDKQCRYDFYRGCNALCPGLASNSSSSSCSGRGDCRAGAGELTKPFKAKLTNRNVRGCRLMPGRGGVKLRKKVFRDPGP